MPEINHDDLNKLMEKLHLERGTDFRGYKPTSLARRVQRRLGALKCSDINTYMEYLDQQPDEYTKLIDSILINVTQFFRDQEAWQIIEDEVIPRIVPEKRPGDQIRMWSAGCATGEEAYSLAIILSEALGPSLEDYGVRIYATNIDEGALAIARLGDYSDDSAKSVPPELLQKYFTKNCRWSLNRDIKKMVIFGQHNLVMDAPISHLDLIVCRNVLIYMSVDLQNLVLSKLHYGLNPRGFLFLGKAESILTASRIISPFNDRWRIFRKE
ncbi:MAG: protein-glutamate O-methyltransferase CheR [Armatimonadota bacterium]|nr:protein-glutamate O-methyltransferase CheR [Armatimonadota bacterium]